MILKPIAEKLTQSKEFTLLKALTPNENKAIEGICESSFAMIIAARYLQNPKLSLVITKNSMKMDELFLDLGSILPSENICKLPPLEILPYEFVKPSEKNERERITSLYKILHKEPTIVVSTVENLLRLLPEKEFLLKKGLLLECNEEYPFEDILDLLIEYGYQRTMRVETFGDFTVKGNIIDIFLPTYSEPVRIEFFGDALETIREFDIDTQLSSTHLKKIVLYPRSELILSPKERHTLVEKLRPAYQEKLDLPEEIVNHLVDGAPLNPTVKGINDLFPLIVNGASLLSYFPEDYNMYFIDLPELMFQRTLILRNFTELYSTKSKENFTLAPELLVNDNIFEKAKERALTLQVMTTTPDAWQWQMKSLPHFQGHIKSVREEITKRLENGWSVVISTNFEGQARRLYDLFREFHPDDNFSEYTGKNNFSIIITPYSRGVEFVEEKILLLTDHEIFGKAYRQRNQFKKKNSRPIDSFLDLASGDPVVHINHGIGIFQGIERMTAGGVERDFLMIEYLDEDKLYVPLDQITMVQKYIGLDGRKPRIDALGKKSSWNRIKQKVQEAVEEIAHELLEIYSKRAALQGYQFPPDTLWQEEFESKFEYEETPDQITAIEDVKDDMESIKPMDRLVCGDVGFGKTEVAIRAAFKSVMAGKQVAILVPTTILAMQHYSTFKKRFSDYPITIDMISRFRSTTETTKIKGKLETGEIDIIVGTHAILGKTINFKNLGLLIIDEEQRFGVKHKEQLKKIRSNIDVLTLSATPIPRTLHMSLAGMRDLSLITTPPENRQSVETYVLEDNPDILKMAISREIEREGQIFYIHNRVETIDVQAAILKELVPEARICVAHGQLPEHELEEIMLSFINFDYDILISTTIIESGLDMPRVNTIIINRADTFGLSQLHQLKGRVGRSATHAYAYLFYPRHIPLSETAQKRLQVISEYSDLGSGFKIAMKDLEIRGAGNILGKEQSGTIMEVGFELYCQMLNDTINRLKGEKPLLPYRTPVYINTNFFIPETYISDERQKIEFYKRFEACENLEEVEALTLEMSDRFGQPPSEVKILIELEKIRALASKLQIGEIIEDKDYLKIRITENTLVNREKIIQFLNKSKNARLQIDPFDKELLRFFFQEKETEKKLIELKKWLQQLF